MPTATSSGSKPIIEELGPVQGAQGAPQELGPIEELGPATPPQTVGRAAGEWWNQVNPVEGIKNTAQMVNHPIDALNAHGAAIEASMKQAKDAFVKGDFLTGIRHVLTAGSPLERSGDQAAAGDYAGAIGSTAGMATNLFGPKLLGESEAVRNAPKSLGGAAEGIYKSALKPSTVNPAKASRAVSGLLDEGIPVSEGGIQKRAGLMKDLNAQVDQSIATDPNAPMDVNRTASGLDKLEAQYSKQALPEADVKTVRGAKDEFLNKFRSEPGGPVDKGLTASEAQELKKATYKSIGDRPWEQRKGAGVESEKNIALDLRDQIQEKFPDVKVPNTRESKMFDAKKFLETAVEREKNKTPLGLGHGLAAMAGGAAGVLSHNPAVGVATGLGGLLLENAALRSKIAIALNSASKGTLDAPIAKMRIQGYINAATRGANSRNEESSQSTGRQE